MKMLKKTLYILLISIIATLTFNAKAQEFTCNPASVNQLVGKSKELSTVLAAYTTEFQKSVCDSDNIPSDCQNIQEEVTLLQKLDSELLQIIESVKEFETSINDALDICATDYINNKISVDDYSVINAKLNDDNYMISYTLSVLNHFYNQEVLGCFEDLQEAKKSSQCLK